jgi:hypothetical protein
MPNRTQTVLETLGATESGLDWGGLTSGIEIKLHDPLFPRIDIKKLENSVKNHGEKKELKNVITFDEFQNIELKTGGKQLLGPYEKWFCSSDLITYCMVSYG